MITLTTMKTLTLALFAALTAAAFAADTPEQIAADYREKAAAALKKVNDTLEKATVPLIADLVKQGDVEGADTLKEQLKAKSAGEPVPTPHASAAALFKLYDSARAKSLEPAQKSAISRIDALLAGADRKKLEVVAELGKVRREVENGKVASSTPANGKPAPVPEHWTYHMKMEDLASLANISLKPDGQFTMSSNEPGKWSQSPITGVITITFANKDPWVMTMNGDGTAMLDRPDTGRRFLKVKKPALGAR